MFAFTCVHPQSPSFFPHPARDFQLNNSSHYSLPKDCFFDSPFCLCCRNRTSVYHFRYRQMQLFHAFPRSLAQRQPVTHPLQMALASAMLGRLLACYMVFAGVVAALPQSFVLDMGSIEGAVLADAPSAPPPNTMAAALSPSTILQTTPFIPQTFTSILASPANSTTTALNNTSYTTCLPTTTIVITLSNLTPRPTTTTEHDEDEDTLNDDSQNADATSFDAATPESLSNWPHWFTAATFTLLFYDFLTLGVFLWLWVFGYLWWFRRGNRYGGARERVWQRRGGVSGEGAVIGMMDRSGRYVLADDWERLAQGSGRRHGRVRSESWGRTRTAREAELESEMRRLGMI